MNNFHTPVLLKEVVLGLRVRKNGIYIDGTIGGGGHAGEILKHGGRVLGIDQDEDAISHLKKKFESEIKERRLILVQGNFADIKDISLKSGSEKVDGILFDLGFSSHEIDKSGRGFSFQKDEFLDMRMNVSGVSGKVRAYDIVNYATQEELYEIFLEYGEEPKSFQIAREIVLTRKKKPIETTFELSKLCSKVVRADHKKNPATRVFLALRIAVNSEVENLRRGLSNGFELLNEGARFLVISFHSLEDRTVKLFFSQKSKIGGARIINKKPILPESYEISQNRRARSAKLRIIQKI